MKKDSPKPEPAKGAESIADWKAAVAKLIEAGEERLQEPQWMEGDWPPWVERAMLQVVKAIVPEADLKPGGSETPQTLGAIHGCKVAIITWLKDENGFAKSNAAAVAEQMIASLDEGGRVAFEALMRASEGPIEAFFDDFERARLEIPAQAGRGEIPEQVEFNEAYTRAIKRLADGSDIGTIGTTATQIYLWMVINWRVVERVPSVAALHKWIAAVFGGNRIGELKTFQKLCERIGLKLRAPGRPRKKR